MNSTSAAQFYSEHLLLITALAGLSLGYFVSNEVTVIGASWVWLPAILVLSVRLLTWRASASLLLHVGIFQHFFAANCQIQNWRDPSFQSNCVDKMLLTPLVIGSIAYSAGAVIYRMLRIGRPESRILQNS